MMERMNPATVALAKPGRGSKLLTMEDQITNSPTEPQALPDQDEDDADLRAKDVIRCQAVAAFQKEHWDSAAAKAGKKYESTSLQAAIAREIRSAVEAEREACAMVAHGNYCTGLTSAEQAMADRTGISIAAAIRARGEAG